MEEALFKKHAKTFYLAAKLFRKKDRESVEVFYNFCRSLDDLVDLSLNKEEAYHLLKKIHSQLQSGALESFPSMNKVMKDYRISPYYLIRLINTLEQDLHPRSIKDLNELLNYCQGVASTVGVVLCKILGPIPKEAIPHAVDLGIAMQLTNITRDVFEDAMKDQIFLPQELFPEGFLDYDTKSDAKKIITHFESYPVTETRKKLLVLADKHYRSAEIGFKHIPLRSRLAIAAAAKMYEAIGQKCMKKPLPKRGFVPLTQKLLLSIPALIKAGVTTYPKRGAVHDTNFYQEMCSPYESV